MVLAVLLAGAGAIRMSEAVGGAWALASEHAAETADSAPEAAICATDSGTMDLLKAVQAREATVSTREAALADRSQALKIAEDQITEKLAALTKAEDDLSKMVAVADQAADADVTRLVTMYENMKPKEAAPLFEVMAPEFAAGFLSRMRPDAAASVLAGLNPKTAYTISVIMAGRNAGVPKN